jgi:hypothetical protein
MDMRVSARKVTIKAAAAVTAAIAVGAVSPAAANATSAHQRNNRPEHRDNLVICKDVRGHHSYETFSFFVSGYGKVRVRDGDCESVRVRPGRTWIVEDRERGYRLRDIDVYGDRYARTDVGDRTALVHADRDDRVIVRFVNVRDFRFTRKAHGR